MGIINKLIDRVLPSASTRRPVSMPQDWRNAAGWDAWYSTAAGGQPPDLSPPLDVLRETVADWQAAGVKRIWVAGCGLSPLCRALAHLGQDVVATDFSAVAVNAQRQAIERRPLPGPTGSFRVEVHDFFDDFETDAFDWIINEKAFQGFAEADLARAAAVHARALRPGREAWFLVHNVWGRRASILEAALEAGGFVVPFAPIMAEYRAALDATGVEYVTILGRDRAVGGDPALQDRLDAVLAAFEPRFREAEVSERARYEGARQASVQYSTG